MVEAGSPPIPPDIVKITAPILFGPLFNWALYGVLCVQTYVYSYNFPDDRRPLKLLVCFVFLLETAQTTLTGADVYYWFMAGFGDLKSIENLRFFHIDIPILGAIISLIVQEFFCYRIWVLNKRLLWFCVVVAVLSVAQASGALWSSLKGKFEVIKLAVYLWFIAGVLADVLIAMAMIYLLRQRRGNENRCSSYVLPRIVRLTVETNTLTATVAIVTFVLYVVFPNEPYYVTSAGIIGKLYSNTLLVTLNNRIYFRDHPFPGGSGNSVYQGPTRPSEHHLPQVKPLGIRVVTMNNTFRLDASLSSTPLSSMELEKGRSDLMSSRSNSSC
ncbi:hypothetical protein BJV78DRAFT_181488 [Lactifluus subvellereus]|nr:hypothetical protein BJV78DRAFT_181488 [Lactifluus subvellereus]